MVKSRAAEKRCFPEKSAFFQSVVHVAGLDPAGYFFRMYRVALMNEFADEQPWRLSGA